MKKGVYSMSAIYSLQLLTRAKTLAEFLIWSRLAFSLFLYFYSDEHEQKTEFGLYVCEREK